MEHFDVDKFVNKSVERLNKKKKPAQPETTQLALHNDSLDTSAKRTGFDLIRQH
jgi:hypothetical protein